MLIFTEPPGQPSREKREMNYDKRKRICSATVSLVGVCGGAGPIQKRQINVHAAVRGAEAST